MSRIAVKVSFSKAERPRAEGPRERSVFKFFFGILAISESRFWDFCKDFFRARRYRLFFRSTATNSPATCNSAVCWPAGRPPLQVALPMRAMSWKKSCYLRFQWSGGKCERSSKKRAKRAFCYVYFHCFFIFFSIFPHFYYYIFKSHATFIR